MWAPGIPFLAFQGRALAHTKTVLLVDNSHRQFVKAHRGLDQGVGAYDQRKLAARELAECVGPPRRGSRAGEQR